VPELRAGKTVPLLRTALHTARLGENARHDSDPTSFDFNIPTGIPSLYELDYHSKSRVIAARGSRDMRPSPPLQGGGQHVRLK